MEFNYIQKSEFDRINESKIDKFQKLALIAKMCRLNTLVEVKKAGSGHLGSSLSAMDIVVFLYHHYLNIKEKGVLSPDRDIYFSSKGHDVPGHYAVLYSLGIIEEEKFLMLRRYNGLDGHPDTKIPGIEANTGSLGMGISKARGMLFAKQHQKFGGKVIVLTGDGEFQEGQNFEALQSTVQQKMNDLIVIMDHNKLQSDRKVEQIVSLRNLEEKLVAFGWHVCRCDGHNFAEIENALLEFEKITDKPKFLIADTIKGRGVSFMEHPQALQTGGGFYKWHSGAPDDDNFNKAINELSQGLSEDLKKAGLQQIQYKTIEFERPASGVSSEYIADAYGKALMELAETNKNFVVLDADLSGDCRVKEFEFAYPARFVECGIAEQDMVSMAGGIALQGLTPIVNSFATFLAARSNEQVYNNLTENKKAIYVCHYAGLIPAGPGKSHQSLRDISLFGAFPNCAIVQAANAEEMRQLTHWAINDSKESVMFRINIGPSPKIVELPKDYKLKFGCGSALTEGSENIMFAYGTVMLNEALLAQEILSKKGIALKVVNMPWLNRFDEKWLAETINGAKHLFFLEDHSTFGGLADSMLDFLIRKDLMSGIKIHKFGVEEYPACGTPSEALKHHRLDGQSLADRILNI